MKENLMILMKNLLKFQKDEKNDCFDYVYSFVKFNENLLNFDKQINIFLLI
jgi:hypothetical protein